MFLVLAWIWCGKILSILYVDGNVVVLAIRDIKSVDFSEERTGPAIRDYVIFWV